MELYKKFIAGIIDLGLTEEEIKKYIDEFILKDEMNDCKTIEKQDIIKLEQINTIKRGNMSAEDKKNTIRHII